MFSVNKPKENNSSVTCHPDRRQRALLPDSIKSCTAQIRRITHRGVCQVTGIIRWRYSVRQPYNDKLPAAAVAVNVEYGSPLKRQAIMSPAVPNQSSQLTSISPQSHHRVGTAPINGLKHRVDQLVSPGRKKLRRKRRLMTAMSVFAEKLLLGRSRCRQASTIIKARYKAYCRSLTIYESIFLRRKIARGGTRKLAGRRFYLSRPKCNFQAHIYMCWKFA